MPVRARSPRPSSREAEDLDDVDRVVIVRAPSDAATNQRRARLRRMRCLAGVIDSGLGLLRSSNSLVVAESRPDLPRRSEKIEFFSKLQRPGLRHDLGELSRGGPAI